MKFKVKVVIQTAQKHCLRTLPSLNLKIQPGVVAHPYNPNTPEAEEGGL
jgi:hypothetical protein